MASDNSRVKLGGLRIGDDTINQNQTTTINSLHLFHLALILDRLLFYSLNHTSPPAIILQHRTAGRHTPR
jgi:hypothetical protein